MKVVVIKYNAGNTQSVLFALERLGIHADVSDSLETISGADKVIFPGVGEASSAMNHLRSRGLEKIIPELKQPVLGICLGMQLMCDYSEEGDTTGLGIFPGVVKKFPPEDNVPHIGWNSISTTQKAFLESVDEEYMYFDHSYYVTTGDFTASTTDYILPFSSALHQDNFYATQFHPEKSGKSGEKILINFLGL